MPIEKKELSERRNYLNLAGVILVALCVGFAVGMAVTSDYYVNEYLNIADNFLFASVGLHMENNDMSFYLAWFSTLMCDIYETNRYQLLQFRRQPDDVCDKYNNYFVYLYKESTIGG